MKYFPQLILIKTSKKAVSLPRYKYEGKERELIWFGSNLDNEFHQEVSK